MLQNIIEKIKDQRVLALRSENKTEIIAAVEGLVKEGQRSGIEGKLIRLVDNWQNDETSASLWAMVVLGKIGTASSIEVLLKILDSDVDIWQEAASDALTQIAQRHGDFFCWDDIARDNMSIHQESGVL